MRERTRETVGTGGARAPGARERAVEPFRKAPRLDIVPSLEEIEAGAGYDRVLLFAEVSSDLETPVSAFIKLRDGGPCFLLESAESGRAWGRYSFLGFDPRVLATSRGGRLVLSGTDAASSAAGPGGAATAGDPVRALFDLVERDRVLLPADRMPFSGGAVGYFGYDVLSCFEDVRLKPPAETEAPSMTFMFPRKLVMFDHLRSRIRLCVLASLPGAGEDFAGEYESAASEIRAMAAALRGGLPAGSGIGAGVVRRPAGPDELTGVESNMSRAEFEGMVERAREHIFAGDAFQVVVSQRFSMPAPGDPLSVYRHLRADNPSPYMFLLELPGVTLVGSSPEPLVTRRGGGAIIRPIAGTRPRGTDEASDEALARELAADEKERAEHIMLVDLARNDLGRVAAPGTVRVSRLFEIERFSHVMHLVSEVEAELAAGRGNYDLLAASFPAGTVVGAPKVRASIIADELEPDARGVYAGAVGYISNSGDMDLCIAIRTVTISGGRACVQAGAGVVADSVPAGEYEETRSKARAIVRALKSAEEA